MPYIANESEDVENVKKRIINKYSDDDEYDRIKDAKLNPFYYQRRYNRCPRCGMSNCGRNH